MAGVIRATIAAFAALHLCTFMAVSEPSPLNPGERAIVYQWLKWHGQYRLATDNDCECGDDIQEFRTSSSGVWKRRPDFHPYVARGDFRKNGQSDLAVVVIKRGETKPTEGLLLIFDGPFLGQLPAYLGKVPLLVHSGLIVHPTTGLPVYGVYFSEGCYYKPTGKTYRKNCETDY